MVRSTPVRKSSWIEWFVLWIRPIYCSAIQVAMKIQLIISIWPLKLLCTSLCCHWQCQIRLTNCEGKEVLSNQLQMMRICRFGFKSRWLSMKTHSSTMNMTNSCCLEPIWRSLGLYCHQGFVGLGLALAAATEGGAQKAYWLQNWLAFIVTVVRSLQQNINIWREKVTF